MCHLTCCGDDAYKLELYSPCTGVCPFVPLFIVTNQFLCLLSFRYSADLQALSDSDRAVELGWSGLDSAAVEGVNLFLSAMPRLVMVAKCEVDGEDEIMEGDPVHCRVSSGGRTWPSHPFAVAVRCYIVSLDMCTFLIVC